MKTTWLGGSSSVFEQGIEGGVGDLVCFIKNVDFEAIASRAIASGFAQFADLVDTPIGGSVDFDHVYRIARANFGAGLAYPAGFEDRLSLELDRQFSAMARMRATVVLPIPRWPLKI